MAIRLFGSSNKTVIMILEMIKKKSYSYEPNPSLQSRGRRPAVAPRRLKTSRTSRLSCCRPSLPDPSRQDAPPSQSRLTGKTDTIGHLRAPSRKADPPHGSVPFANTTGRGPSCHPLDGLRSDTGPDSIKRPYDRGDIDSLYMAWNSGPYTQRREELHSRYRLDWSWHAVRVGS